MYRQLYERYRRVILEGQLLHGSQLPSTRELAAELRISRNTVMNAFDQLLSEGYIRGKRGSGTFVEAGLVKGGQSDKSHHMGSHAGKARLAIWGV